MPFLDVLCYDSSLHTKQTGYESLGSVSLEKKMCKNSQKWALIQSDNVLYQEKEKESFRMKKRQKMTKHAALFRLIRHLDSAYRITMLFALHGR